MTSVKIPTRSQVQSQKIFKIGVVMFTTSRLKVDSGLMYEKMPIHFCFLETLDFLFFQKPL